VNSVEYKSPVRSNLEQTADPNHVLVNMGPSHPATHGTIQIIAALDGERVAKADIHCGYLHRGFEKESEHHTYHKIIPFTDRLNYCSALNNNFAYVEGVEKLLGIELTPRCIYLRTLLGRVQPGRRPRHLRRRHCHGNGRHDRVFVPDDHPRLHLRAPEPAHRRAAHLLLRPVSAA
jgi:hypothetical protein